MPEAYFHSLTRALYVSSFLVRKASIDLLTSKKIFQEITAQIKTIHLWFSRFFVFSPVLFFFCFKNKKFDPSAKSVVYKRLNPKT